MQAITWSREEFQASVNAKLAMLRANRHTDSGLNLSQRLELAEDRTQFADLQKTAQAKREAAARQHKAGALMMKTLNNAAAGQADCIFMQRADDDVHPSSGDPCKQKHDGADEGSPAHGKKSPLTDSYAANQAPIQSPQAFKQQDHKSKKTIPDMSLAVDSHATDFTLKPGRPSTFVPHALRYQLAVGKASPDAVATHVADAFAQTNETLALVEVDNLQCQDLPQDNQPGGPPDDSHTELPADKVRFKPSSLYSEDIPEESSLQEGDKERRRLIEQTQRQSSAQWKVLDRATVLSCLVSCPKGLTMGAIAAHLMGASASARDTRRLSALMKREEKRNTIAHGGRGHPIVITNKGRAELQAMDILKVTSAALVKRQKRISYQAQRLIMGGATKTAQEKVEAKKARAAARQKSLAEKSTTKRPVGRPKKQLLDTAAPTPATAVDTGTRQYRDGKPVLPGARKKPTQ